MTGRRPSRRAAAWLLLLAVVAVSLVVGASHPGPPPTATQKADAIDAVLKCPVCEDLSVADSSAQLAVVMRAQVLQAVKQGQRPSAIETHYVDLYGPQELLRPRNPLVWVVPVVAAVVALAALAGFFWRRRRAAAAERPAAPEDVELVERALAEDSR